MSDKHRSTTLVPRPCLGHAHLPDSLLAGHADDLERALWSTGRKFDERYLLRRIKERKYHADGVGTNWETTFKVLEQDAELIRNQLRTTPQD